MKRVWVLSIAAVLCLALVALADDKMASGKTMEGTISKVDMAGKMMMVKGADGKDSSVYWDDKTKVEGGDLKEGSKVHYKGAMKDGKMMATWVHVGEMHKM
jgi:hypothetical protein